MGFLWVGLERVGALVELGLGVDADLIFGFVASRVWNSK